jgi:hypothetical protein
MLKGYLSKTGLGSQTKQRKTPGMRVPYTGAGRPSALLAEASQEKCTVVERRIKPYFEEQAELERRADQTRVFRRNQAIGLVIVALTILVFWLFRTNPQWIFPPGWWRL